jgi:hypothetical protein
MSTAWAGDAPCSSAKIEPERAAICVYNIGKKPAFATLKVMVNGVVQGKLAKRQPWMLVSVGPGVQVVGIDIGNAPQARRKVDAVAGQVSYVRYVASFTTRAGFFDTMYESETQLLEVSASDARGDLDQFTSSRESKRKRT